MGYLDELRSYTGAEKGADDALTKPTKPSSVSFVGTSGGAFLKNPVRALADWRKSIGALDPLSPQGMPMGRRQCLYDASQWWLNGFGEQAARDGWTTADIFGLWPNKPRWGGLIDRLGQSRSLIMTADRASWRSGVYAERFNRGAYPDLQPFWAVSELEV